MLVNISANSNQKQHMSLTILLKIHLFLLVHFKMSLAIMNLNTTICNQKLRHNGLINCHFYMEYKCVLRLDNWKELTNIRKRTNSSKSSLWVLVLYWLRKWTVSLAIKMLLFSTQKVCLCAIFSRVRRAAYLYDFFFCDFLHGKAQHILVPSYGMQPRLWCVASFQADFFFKENGNNK